MSFFSNRLRTPSLSGSHDEEPDGDYAEHRRDQRIPQARRTVTLEADGRSIPFSLNNLSIRGASGRGDDKLKPGERVMLRFEGDRTIVGMVRWNKGSVVGIQFVDPLPLDLLRGETVARSQREPRYSVSRLATIRWMGHERPAVIRNVSRHGMLIETAFAMLPGQKIELCCGAMDPLAGHVRWSRNGRAGLQLLVPIALDRFEDATAGAAI